MESVLDNVTESLSDAGDLVVGAVLGDDEGMSGGRLRRAVLGLLLVGVIVGFVLWRKGQARRDTEATASA